MKEKIYFIALVLFLITVIYSSQYLTSTEKFQPAISKQITVK